jgi:Fic family protein
MPERVAAFGGAPVSIELSKEQVDRVLRGASANNNVSLLLTGLADLRDVFASAADVLDDARMSRSLLAGLLLLTAFPADGGSIAITQLARGLGMSVSTAHRYVSTLLAVGLVERDPVTRQYRLARAL